MSCLSLVACRVSVEKSADSIMGVPLYVTCCFSLAALNILSLSLIFAILITVCLAVIFFGLILSGTRFLDLVAFPRLGKFSAVMSSDMLSAPFFLFSFWDPYNVNASMLDVVLKVSYTVLISFYFKKIFSVQLE